MTFNQHKLRKNDMPISFYNTQKIVNASLGIYSLQNSRFAMDIRYANNITIISAYYNISYFDMLYDNMRNKDAKVEIIIPAEKGVKKLVKQKSELSNFVLDNPNFHFRFVDSGYLLHTKLYIIEKDKNKIVWIGSSNASTNSISKCEELMLRIPHDVPTSIFDYINSLRNNSFEFQERSIDLRTSSLRNFFNQGSLYTKTTESFNPSIEIDFGDYHNDVINALKANIAANSLTGLLIRATNRISILELLKLYCRENNNMDIADIEANRRGEGIKKYGLFTSYGLWIPDGYIQKTENFLEESEGFRKRELRLTSIRKLLNDTEGIVKIYKRVLKQIANLLINKQDNLFFEGDENVNINRLKSKLDWCKARLNDRSDNHFYRLLLYPYYSSSMPNIWDDNYAVSNFIESFYYSLMAEHEKTQHQNLLYQSIRNFNANAFDCGEEVSPKEHLKKLLANKDNRMFCQYDLKDFFSYNESISDQYKFTKLSDADDNMIKKGKEVFYLEENYFVYGPIIKIRSNRYGIFIKCDFENGDQEEYSVAEEENLYFIEIKI
jgi:HKD family nuclease